MTKSRFRLKQSAIIAASIHLIFADVSAWAGPVGPQVVNGTATFAQPNASTLNVTNSPGAIINWKGFSIGAGELTRFIQQSTSSSVLNRVVGADISQIYGQLLSNGRVFLINPSGIIIGPGAVVDTAGFVASTLNMLDADFLAGKLKFQGDAASGSIVNQGWIRTGYGGKVILVAPQIENSGLIHTPGGELILAAGQKLTITSLDLEGVQFEVQAPTDTVVNLGKLLADGGAVGVFAGTLRHSGEIRANSLVYDQAGQIVLQAANEIQLTAGSTTTADGKIGGSVTVQASGGLDRVAGTVSAQGSSGKGGDIRILGERVAMVENAVVNASGASGGGQILVGGDYQGSNTAVQNASNTFVGADATLRADATGAGDGGRIIVWSDDKAQFYGSLSAQGGAESGNGGFAEVSGKQNLIFAGSANLGAPKGNLGNLLLDPLDQYVFSGGGLNPTIIDESTDFPSNAATVSPETLKDIVGNVTLFASRYMRISNDIDLTVTSVASGATPTPNKGLTVQVGTYAAPAAPDPLSLASDTQINNIPNRLDIGANITTANGAVSLSAPRIETFAGSMIATAGGAISLAATGAIETSSLTLDAGSGAVTGMASNGALRLAGILSSGSTTLSSAGDSLQIGNIGATGAASLTSDNFISTGSITTAGGAVNISSTGSAIQTFSTIDTTNAAAVPAGAPVTITAPSSITTRSILAGTGNITLSGSNLSNSSSSPLDTSGSVSLTATSGNISSFRINSAASVTANATNNFGSAFVNLFSDGVLNANTVSATTTQCSFFGSCSSASVSLNGELGVNIGTVTATAPTNFVNKANFGVAYADERFENINSSVNVFSNAGPIHALGAGSLITANNVFLGTGLLSGGGIGTNALPLKVDVKSNFGFAPNGEFNTQLTGTGPNNLNLQIGVAGPLPLPQSYTGTLTRTGQINLNVSADTTTVTVNTLAISSGFDTRVFNTSPFVQLYVPGGKLVATSVTVPKGDQTGIVSPSQQFSFDNCFFNCPPQPARTIEALPVRLWADNDVTITSYTREAGTLAKNSDFRSFNGSVSLGTVNANIDSLFVFGSTGVSIPNLTHQNGATIQSATGNIALGNVTVAGNLDASSNSGSITISNLNATGSASASTGSGNITVGLVAAGTGGVFLSAPAGIVQAQSQSTGVEVTSGGTISVNAMTIGASAFANPLDLAGGTINLTSNGGSIGFAAKPIVASTQNLSINAGSTFNVDTGVINLSNLTVTASPSGVGTVGADRARVTSNGQIYDFVSDGTNFTLGGANFPAAVPAAQFTDGTLSFTATSGNLTLGAMNFSAGSGNVSATTNGNLANITQTPGQAINLGTGTLTLRADGNVTLEGVNAGGMSAANATFNTGSGCTFFFGPCGVTSFTANQTLTDTALGGGTWSVTSRGAINTGALQLAGVNFTSFSGGVITGAIGTAARPASSVSMSTTGGTGNIQTGIIEADAVSLAANGDVVVASGTVASDPAINPNNTGGASINLSSQTGTVTVNGALNAADVTLVAPTAINTGNINPAAPSPTNITFIATSGSTPITTGSLDATSIQSFGGCFGCGPGNITIGGAIGANTKGTLVSLGGNGAVSIGGAVTLDPLVAGSVFLGAGTTLTGTGGNPLGAVTAGDGSSITLRAFNSNTATPFQFTQIDAGATGSVTVNAPAGIIQTLATGSGGGIKAATVDLSATSAGSAIEGPAGFAPLPLTLRETSDLTINSGGSVNLDRTGVPLLSNLDITRSSSASAFSLTGFAAGQNVTVSFLSGTVSVGASNTTATPLYFAYRNTDSVNGNLAGTVIATKGGNVFLSATQNLTTGAIDTKSGAALVPDGSITLQAGQALTVNNTVNAGTNTIFAFGTDVAGSGQLVSANSVFVDAFSGNIGSGATPLAISTPVATLEAFGANPSGNVFAALTGTTNLTINANDGFTVDSTVPFTNVDITTRGSGIGPVSLTSTGAQNFGLARHPTLPTVELNAVTSTTSLASFALNVQSGDLSAKGGVAADALTLSTSGTLTLDGSSSALTLSNTTQNLFGSGGLVIQGDVTASATTSQSMSTSGNLTFTGKGTLSSASGQNLFASGDVAFTSQGGGITLSAVNQGISAFGNLDFSAQGGPISVQATNQSISGFGGASILTLQGGGAAGQSVSFTGSGSQTIQTSDSTGSSIQLLGGGGANAATSIVYSGSGTQFVQGGNIVLAGGSNTGASSLIGTATGAQFVRATGNITLTGGSAAGATARIENTSSNEQRVGESEFIPFCCSQPYQTDNVVLQGGNGAEAAIVASGQQKIQANSGVMVLGGSGSGGIARIESTSASAEQRIGCQSGLDFCSNFLQTLDVTAGANGAFALISAGATQRLFGFSDMKLTGDATNGGSARITTTGSSQFVRFFGGANSLTAGAGTGSDAEILSSGTQDLQFGTLSLTGGGTAGGNTAIARISAAGTQSLNFFGTTTLTGGAGPNSVARITTPADQTLSYSSLVLAGGSNSGSFAKVDAGGTQQLFGGSISLTAQGTEVAPIPNASAIIEGHDQQIFSGAITLTGGSGLSGSTSDAVIRNLTGTPAGTQFISASNITMNGGHTFSTTGILNQGTGTQTIDASSGITMTSDPTALVDSFVLIQNTPATEQFITGALSLTNSGAGTVAVTTPAKQTIIANNGGISITSQSTDTGSVTKVSAGGDQLIRTRFVDVQTAAGSTGDASLSATGNQWIHTTFGSLSGDSVPGPVTGISLRVAAKGSGTASVTAGASQLLELDYPEQLTQGSSGGTLMIGDTAAQGTSRVKAVDQNIFARSIVVQGPAGNEKTSELKASGTQTITTLQGGIEVLGGSGNYAVAGSPPSAQIDPLTQIILANGAVDVAGGSGINAVAQIVSSGVQVIVGTNGGITLTGGGGSNADALISTPGSLQTISTVGLITLTGGTGPGADASIISANGTITAPFTSTVGATLGPPLPAGIGGGPPVVSGGASSGADTAGDFVISQVLADEANQTAVVGEAAPPTEESTDERVPICR